MRSFFPPFSSEAKKRRGKKRRILYNRKRTCSALTANATGVFLAALETVFNLCIVVVNNVIITFAEERVVMCAVNRVFILRSKTSLEF